MTLFQDTGSDPRAAAAQLADVLVFYGAIGDAACGNPPGFALRKASLAVALARTAGLNPQDCDAIYFAGLMNAAGALGNTAFRKGERLSERSARMERWDVPADGARACATIATLPRATADMVRWQAECWDGTGYPDQLRWHGIPDAAQFLAIADAFLRCSDPEEALGVIAQQSGRAFAPHAVTILTMWFHLNAGEAQPVTLPVDALESGAGDAEALLEAIADRVDAHNGVEGRWRRVARLSDATAAALALGPDERKQLAVATRLFGAGEITADIAEDFQFDPLARFGNLNRARNAKSAAVFIDGNATLSSAAETLRARSEWYDGTGKPNGLDRSSIPRSAGILAAAIALIALDAKYRDQIQNDRISPADRIDTASGTQFDPQIVRALLDAAKTHA